MYIDSHAHLGDEGLFLKLSEVLARASQAKLGAIVNICTNELTLQRGLSMQECMPKVYLAAACTPHDVEKEGEFFFQHVEKAALDKKLVAIGETGLDYYYEHSPKKLQQIHLLRYFELAKKVDLPVVFHCREAFEDLFALANEAYSARKALLHCFTGTLEEARKVLDLGWYISFSGIITFKKSEILRQVACFVPMDRMLIETDSPYLAPQSQRGKMNEPAFVVETAAVIASLKGISLEEVARHTQENAKAFFSF